MSNFLIGSTYGFLENRHHHHSAADRRAALGKGFGWAFIINILLTLLGYIPGLIHAFWVQTRD